MFRRKGSEIKFGYVSAHRTNETYLFVELVELAAPSMDSAAIARLERTSAVVVGELLGRMRPGLPPIQSGFISKHLRGRHNPSGQGN